jgi:hypothetical protein
MQFVIYAVTLYGYRVQVIEDGEIVHEYSAGNCVKESQTVIDPSSPNAVTLRQLNRWAKQTAGEIAKEHRIPADRISYDTDLEEQLREQDAEFFALDAA